MRQKSSGVRSRALVKVANKPPEPRSGIEDSFIEDDRIFFAKILNTIDP